MSVLFFLKHFCKVLYTCTLRKVKEKKQWHALLQACHRSLFILSLFICLSFRTQRSVHISLDVTSSQ